MDELIAALIEAVTGLVTAVFKILPAILDAFLYLLAASITIIAYAVSPRFREKKRQEWSERPGKKYWELGISSVCVVALASLVVWLAWPKPEPAIRETVQIEAGRADEDLRLRINGATNNVTLAVKKGGTRKIVETDSLEELKTAVRENVTVVGQTNRASAAAGSRR